MRTDETEAQDRKPPTRLIRTYVAEPVTKADPPPRLEIHFNQPIPHADKSLAGDAALDQVLRAYRSEADRIVKALVHSAPGGLVDALLSTLLLAKASHFRVPFGTPAPAPLPSESDQEREERHKLEVRSARTQAFQVERGAVVDFLRRLAQDPPAMTSYALLSRAAMMILNDRHHVGDVARVAAAEGVTPEQLETAFAEDRSTNGKPWFQELRRARRGAMKQERRDVVKFLQDCAPTYGGEVEQALRSIAATISGGYHCSPCSEDAQDVERREVLLTVRLSPGETSEAEDRGAFREMREAITFIAGLPAKWIEKEHLISMLRVGEHRLKVPTPAPAQPVTGSDYPPAMSMREKLEHFARIGSVSSPVRFDPVGELEHFRTYPGFVLTRIDAETFKNLPGGDRPVAHPIPRCKVTPADQGTDPDLDSSCCPDEGPLSEARVSQEVTYGATPPIEAGLTFPSTPIIPNRDAGFSGGRLLERSEIMLFLIDALDGITNPKIQEFVRNTAKRIIACEHLGERKS